MRESSDPGSTKDGDGTGIPARSIPVAAEEGLRKAVAQMARGRPADAELRQALRIACTDAHERGTRAEQLLVALKSALDEAITEAGVGRGPVRDDIARRAVTLCIDEYYARPRPE